MGLLRRSLNSIRFTMQCAGVGAFIHISGGSFVDENCKEFFFSGYNTWEVGTYKLGPSDVSKRVECLAYTLCSACHSYKGLPGGMVICLTVPSPVFKRPGFGNTFCVTLPSDSQSYHVIMTQLLETAAGYSGNSGDLAAQFAAAAANNLTVVRMFGFGVASGFPLQYSPGSYNERAFQAFDKVHPLQSA